MNIIIFLIGIAVVGYGFVSGVSSLKDLLVIMTGFIIAAAAITRSKRIDRWEYNMNENLRTGIQAYRDDVAKHPPDSPSRRFGRSS